MNIKGRLKKLEIKSGSGNEFCACFQKLFAAQIRSVYDNVSFDESKFTLPENDYCPKCARQVSARDFDLIENINQIYGNLEI